MVRSPSILSLLLLGLFCKPVLDFTLFAPRSVKGRTGLFAKKAEMANRNEPLLPNVQRQREGRCDFGPTLRHMAKKHWMPLEAVLWRPCPIFLSAILHDTECSWIAWGAVFWSFGLVVAEAILRDEEQPGAFRKTCSLLTLCAFTLWPCMCLFPLWFFRVSFQTILACGPFIHGLTVVMIYLRPSAEATWFTRSAWIHVFWDAPTLTVSYLVDTCCRGRGKPPYFHSGHKDLDDPRAFDVASEIQGTPFFLGGRPLAQDVEKLKSLGVGLVVNMTKEWCGPEATYEKRNIQQIRCPTLDTEAPSRETLEDGANAVAAWLEQHPGKKVYIHCKGGRSRSSCMLVACLLKLRLFENASEAVEQIRRDRPVVDDGILKYASLQAFAEGVK